MTVCHKCGDANEAGRDFCPTCGEFLGWAVESPAPAPAAPSPKPIRPGSPPSPADPATVSAGSDPPLDAVRQAEEEARLAEDEARRVRAEADAKAMAMTNTAQRQATEEVREARQVAAAKANATIDAARRDANRTGGVSSEEVAKIVEQVRREAESQAQIDTERAELRAARKARRAREEAHAQAQAEAAEAERKAADKLRRAAAMIAAPVPVTAEAAATATASTASTAPTPIADPVRSPARNRRGQSKPAPSGVGPGPVLPGPRQPGSGPPQPGSGPAETGPGPVQPGPARRRPPPNVAAPAQPMAQPGDTICAHCHAGSDPSRRFCRRCGRSLVAPPAPPRLDWWQRFRQRLPSTRSAGPGSGQGQAGAGQAPRNTKPPLSLRTVVRRVAGAAAVVAVVLGLGPLRPQTGRQLTSLRQGIMPKPTYIDGQVALAGPNNAPVPRLTDKLVSTGEFSSTQVGAGPPASTDPPVFSVKIGTDGDLNRPIDLYKVGIITGLIGEQPAKHPAPHHVLLVAYDHAGHQEKAKTIDLHDTSAFQSFTFATSKVSRVDFYVVDTYSSPDRQGPYIIDEVELFTRS